MTLYLLTAVIFCFSISGLYGAENIQIRLEAKVYVTSGKVFLKDIASLEGTDADLLDIVGSLSVMDSPEYGTVSTFSRQQIEKIVRQSLNVEPEIRITGAPIVQIRLQERQARAEEIVPVLRAFLIETTQWRDQEIKILSIKNLEKIKLPVVESDLRVSAKSPVFGHGKILVPFDVVRNGKKLNSFWVTAEIRVTAAILTAGKKIAYNKTITPDDIVSVETEIKDLNAAYIRNADEATGKISKRLFLPGDLLTRKSFTKPFLVNSGDTVHLRLERNGLVLTSLARAEQDGRLGQIIRVRNLEFSSVLKAKVTGRAQVEIP